MCVYVYIIIKNNYNYNSNNNNHASLVLFIKNKSNIIHVLSYVKSSTPINIIFNIIFLF